MAALTAAPRVPETRTVKALRLLVGTTRISSGRKPISSAFPASICLMLRSEGGADRGAKGPGDKNGEGFAAAGGDDQDIVRPQADIFRLSGEHLFDVEIGRRRGPRRQGSRRQER